MEMNNRHYVYVYIDPRNFEEFYYGKGIGSRSHAHLQENNDSVKVARIRAIRAEGLEPIIRIIARGLSSEEALMVETALIWKLGRTLTNVAAGQYVGRFRPPDTWHKRLPRFDFENGIYYVNVGEGETRSWQDCQRYGFLAAGGAARWSDQLRALEIGDVVVAYLKGSGYVGVGTVVNEAVPFVSFEVDGVRLSQHDLAEPNIAHDADDRVVCEYLTEVRWEAAVAKAEAKWEPKSGLFTSQLVRASLEAQPRTISFVEEQFGVDLHELADARG